MYVDLMTIPKFTMGAWVRGANLSFGVGELIFFGVDLATRNLKDEFPELAFDQAAFLAGYYYAPRQFNYYGWVTLAAYLGIYIDKYYKSPKKATNRSPVQQPSTRPESSEDWEWADE